MSVTISMRSVSLWRCCVASAVLAGGAAATPARPGGEFGCGHDLMVQSAAAPNAARARPDYDDATGRDLSNYPPHRLADFIHMRLDLVIPDMNQTRLDGVETLTFSPIADTLDSLSLDARGMSIRRVRVGDRECTFSHEGTRLQINLDPPIAAGTRASLVIEYAITQPMDGLYWFPQSDAWPGRPAQLHTQGEPQTISSLFPCHDFPNEKLTTELVVTVPAGYTVSSNGRLVEHTRHVQSIDEPAGGSHLAACERFHWLQDKPHANYLVSLVVGKFDVVDVGTKQLPMPVYVPPGRGPDVRGTYGKTPEMAALFSDLLDEPYTWARYAQLVVWNFAAGGMENTSATSMYDTAIIDRASLADTDLEGLISHELAHQWFGDLLTCNSWEHIWLNEGFATYLTSLWLEHKDGLAGYQSVILGNMDNIIARDAAEAPYQPGMASKIYKNAWDTFRKPANPYAKGASILHMLRERLGDDAFFKGVALYIDRHKYETVETSDLRRALEDVSGESLQQFFEQWCFRPGVPHLDVDIAWDHQSRQLHIEVHQRQLIDPYNPAFEFDLPVWIDVPDADAGRRRDPSPGRWLSVPVTGRGASAAFELPEEPRICAVDPKLAVLAKLNIQQPAHRWLAQLEASLTPAATIQAARSLGELGDAESTAALRRVAHNSRAYKSLRVEAVKALERAGDREALLELADAGIPIYEVRAAACESLSRLAATSTDADGRRRAAESLQNSVARDASTKVRGVAVAGLARMKAEGALEQAAAAMRFDSQDDRLRQAALEALELLDEPACLSLAASLTRPGVLGRTRALAVQTLAKLAHHDPDVAYQTIAPLLRDPEPRTRDAAGQALADMKDPRAIAALRSLIDDARDPNLKQKAENWLDSLRDGLDSKSEPAAANAAP